MVSSLAPQQNLSQNPSARGVSNHVENNQSELFGVNDQVKSIIVDMTSTIESNVETVGCETRTDTETLRSDSEDEQPKRSTLIEIHDRVDLLYQEMLDLLNEAKTEGVCDGLIQVNTNVVQKDAPVASDETNVCDTDKISTPKKATHRKRSLLCYDTYKVPSSNNDRAEKSKSSNIAQKSSTKKRVSWSIPAANDDSSKAFQERRKSDTILQSNSYELDTNNIKLSERRTTDTKVHQYYHDLERTNRPGTIHTKTKQPCLDERRDSVLEFLDNERAALAWSKEQHQQELRTVSKENVSIRSSLDVEPSSSILCTSEENEPRKREKRQDSVLSCFDLECTELASSEKKLQEELLAVDQNSLILSFDSCSNPKNTSCVLLESIDQKTKEERCSTLVDSLEETSATIDLTVKDIETASPTVDTDSCQNQDENIAHTSRAEDNTQSTKDHSEALYSPPQITDQTTKEETRDTLMGSPGEENSTDKLKTDISRESLLTADTDSCQNQVKNSMYAEEKIQLPKEQIKTSYGLLKNIYQTTKEERLDTLMGYLDEEHETNRLKDNNLRDPLLAVDTEAYQNQDKNTVNTTRVVENTHSKKDFSETPPENIIQTTKEKMRDTLIDLDCIDEESASNGLTVNNLQDSLLGVGTGRCHNQDENILHNEENIQVPTENNMAPYSNPESIDQTTQEERRDSLIDHLDEERATSGLMSNNLQESLLVADTDAPYNETKNTMNQPTTNQRRCSLLPYIDYDVKSPIEVENIMNSEDCSVVKKGDDSESSWKSWFRKKFILKPWSFFSHLLSRFFCISNFRA